VEKDLYLPSLPGRATADVLSSINLPQEWLIYLRSLDNSHIFSPFDLEGKVVTFACEYKCGQQDTAASRQLSLYLCSGQHQRRALGFKADLYGATVVDTTLRIYVSRWEDDDTIVRTIPLFTFISANNNKGVYPTPYKFSLATFSEFLKCYLFLCNLADQAAADATKVFEKWNTRRGREDLKKKAKTASINPWRPNIPVTPAASRKTLRFGDDPLQEDIQPHMMEDCESFEEDMEDAHIIAGMEDENGSDMLTRSNVTAISSRMAKDVQRWAQGKSLFDDTLNNATIM